MQPLEIQYELKKCGITQKQIAAELGISEVTVSDVILMRKISKRVMQAVSKAIDREPHDVFFDYYRSKAKRTAKVANH